MKTLRIQLSIAYTIVGLAFVGQAAATTTYAEANAMVSPNIVKQSITAGPEGAHASAAQDIPSAFGDVFVSSHASSVPGSLSATGLSRTAGAPGDFQGWASAVWTDAFAITAAGHGPYEKGTFSGAVEITGKLLTEYMGRVYSDTRANATVDIFPGTGYNGGRTIMSGSARNAIGYDIPGIHSGGESFNLVFTDVPFTFGQSISVTLALNISAAVNAIDSGVTGRAEADYAHTMTWSGISEVRDSSGRLLTTSDYTAVSADSGFNFAPVPEPNSWALMITGLFALGLCTRRDAH